MQTIRKLAVTRPVAVTGLVTRSALGAGEMVRREQHEAGLNSIGVTPTGVDPHRLGTVVAAPLRPRQWFDNPWSWAGAFRSTPPLRKQPSSFMERRRLSRRSR